MHSAILIFITVLYQKVSSEMYYLLTDEAGLYEGALHLNWYILVSQYFSITSAYLMRQTFRDMMCNLSRSGSLECPPSIQALIMS